VWCGVVWCGVVWCDVVLCDYIMLKDDEEEDMGGTASEVTTIIRPFFLSAVDIGL
jgi:hypothetical protein